MARPLRYLPNTNIEFQEMTAAELSRLRYNLRLRYADMLRNGGPGSIIVGGGTTFGSASNTERTVGSQTNNRRFSDNNPSTGTTTRTQYNYGLNLANIPAFPTDFTNSYCAFDASINEFFQAREVSHFLIGIINDTINEMRTGDELGTYRVATNSPGTGWTNMGLFFRDTFFNNQQINTYNLWLRTTLTAPSSTTVLPMYINGDGDFQEMDTARYILLENLLFTVLQSRIAAGSLHYSIDGTGVARGSFIDTRRSGETRNDNQSGDNYTSTLTPSGGATNFRTYTLRLV